MTNQSFIEIGEADFLTLLEKLSADYISAADYVIISVDSTFFDYGEVPLEKGKRADSCSMHPVTFARAAEKSEFEDRLFSDPEGLLSHLIDAFVNDCEPCDIETALDVAYSFLCSLPYHTDIETFIDYINCDRDDDEMTLDDIRNMIVEELTA
jgi:hypothetical protein